MCNFHRAWRLARLIPCNRSIRTAARLFPLRPARQLEECDFCPASLWLSCCTAFHSPRRQTVMLSCLLRSFLELKVRNFHLAWRLACQIPCNRSIRTAVHLFLLRPARQLEECDFCPASLWLSCCTAFHSPRRQTVMLSCLLRHHVPSGVCQSGHQRS